MTQDISARFDEKFDFVESEMNEWERIHYNHLKKFWLSEIKASNTALLEGLLAEVEGKDDPYDHGAYEGAGYRKALSDIASLIKEKLKN